MRLANIFAITALLTSLVMVPAQAQPPTLSDLLGLEKPIDRLGVESRATIKEFVASVEMAAKESKEWRGVIDRMRADFASLPQEAGLESKQVVDFMLDRAKDNIGDMVAISKAINDKDYGQALKLFTEMQDRGPSKYPPVIGNFNPKIIPIKWTDSEKFQLDTKETVVVFTGWNFNPDGKSLKAECRNADGKFVKDATKSLKVSSRYLAQLVIASGNGLSFHPEIMEVVLIQEDKVLARIPVIWGERPPKPVTILSLKFTYRTMDEDKDNDDSHVHAGIFWKGKNVGEGATQGANDPNTVWKDYSIHGPFELKLTQPVPIDSVGEIKIEIRHIRNGGDPAWRFRVQRVEAMLSDNTGVIVLTEDDQAQKDVYNHRPGQQKDHCFDLRGRKRQWLRTPQIPLSKR